MARIDDMLRHMKEQDGSDLHLAAGISPRIRSHGELVEVEGWPELTDESVREIVREIATELDWQHFEECGDLDFAYGLEGVARFRANYFVQERGAGAVFRIIPEEIQTLEDLKLPAAIESLCHLSQGLVLITGPTGSGKSTTLAGVINEINHTYSRHIVTIENPVEFVHQNRSSILSHREVGSHTLGFGPALRASIRQDADVVLVGEMRDMETIALAITAAEMGMLVFGTGWGGLSVATANSRRQGPLCGPRDPAEVHGPCECDSRGKHTDVEFADSIRQRSGNAIDGRLAIRGRRVRSGSRRRCPHEGHREGPLRAPGRKGTILSLRVSRLQWTVSRSGLAVMKSKSRSSVC